MKFKKWTKNVMKQFKWYDIKLAQWAAMFVVLALVTGWPAFLTTIKLLDWYWYLLFAIITGLPVARKMFVK